MNSYFFKKEKVIELLNQVEKDLMEKSKIVEKAIKLDYEKWEIKIEIEKLIRIIDNMKEQEYLPKFSKQEIVDGIGKIALVNSSNPYINLNFILTCIYTNNRPCIILENKLLASNIAIIEVMKESFKKLNYDSNIIEYKEVVSKDEIINTQDEYDLIYYLGNKEEYLNFTKRIHVDSKFENFGEIYIYVDSDEFREEVINIDKFAYKNDFKVCYYNTNLENTLSSINKRNNINKISIIFTKNIEKAYEFVKKIKTERIYINEIPEEEFLYNINQNNLVFNKLIMLKK